MLLSLLTSQPTSCLRRRAAKRVASSKRCRLLNRSGFKVVMKTFAMFAMVFLCLKVYGWECLDVDNSSDIEKHWNVRDHVFVAQVMKAAYLPGNSYDQRFSYELRVTTNLKGLVDEAPRLIGDPNSPLLEVSGQYIFFLDNMSLNLCTLVLPFQFEWAERTDINAAEYVRKIINLSGYQP